MPFFKAFRDVYDGAKKKFISKNKIYQIVDFDFLDDEYEFAIIDDLGEVFWVSNNGLCNYKHTFHQVKVFKMNYQNGKITTTT